MKRKINFSFAFRSFIRTFVPKYALRALAYIKLYEGFAEEVIQSHHLGKPAGDGRGSGAAGVPGVAGNAPVHPSWGED